MQCVRHIHGLSNAWTKWIPFYLGSFNTNYIIFRNVEIFKGCFFFQITNFCEGKYWVFGIILFFKNEFSKVIIYSIGMCQTTKGTTIMNPHGRLIFNGIWLRYVCNNVYIKIDVCFILYPHLNPFKPCGPLLHFCYCSKVFKVTCIF